MVLIALSVLDTLGISVYSAMALTPVLNVPILISTMRGIKLVRLVIKHSQLIVWNAQTPPSVPPVKTVCN